MVHPWIGRVLATVVDDVLYREQFDDLCIQRAGFTEHQAQPAWDLLFEHAAHTTGGIYLPRLRQVVGRDRPPLDFLVDENELAGPILSTIHASKGREASRVHLMLPHENFVERDRNPLSPSEIAEEMRVLYVGATRARNNLFTGKSSSLYASRLDSGRVIRVNSKKKRQAQIEIGMKEDLLHASLLDLFRDEDEVSSNQDWIWDNRSHHTSLRLEYRHSDKRNVVYSEEDHRELGTLQKGFGKDLFELGKRVGNGMALTPSGKIKHVRMVGVTTFVVPESERQGVHEPWSVSGFALAPVMSGFSPVYYKEPQG